jgi:hypothetical protein
MKKEFAGREIKREILCALIPISISLPVHAILISLASLSLIMMVDDDVLVCASPSFLLFYDACVSCMQRRGWHEKP